MHTCTHGHVSFLTLWNKLFLCESTPRVLLLSLHAHNQGVLAGGPPASESAGERNKCNRECSGRGQARVRAACPASPGPGEGSLPRTANATGGPGPGEGHLPSTASAAGVGARPR